MSAFSSEAKAIPPSAVLAVEQRLDAEAVARENEPAGAAVPQRYREHAAQPLGEAVAVLLEEVHDHLGVAARPEAVAGRLELGAELGVVVDLPVLNDVDAAVLAGHRLMPSGEVDDRQAARGERDGPGDHVAVVVRAAMHERGAHRRERRGVRPARTGGSKATDAAHLRRRVPGAGSRRRSR